MLKLLVPDVLIPGISIFVNPAPLPKNDVAVTELIPDIFVALSPTIFPANVETPDTFNCCTSRLLKLLLPDVLIPGILIFVNPAPLPENDVAVKIPVTITPDLSPGTSIIVVSSLCNTISPAVPPPELASIWILLLPLDSILKPSVAVRLINPRPLAKRID